MRGLTNCTLLIAALCLVWTANPTRVTAQGMAGIRDLRCENAINPRAVKTQHPQLSWEFGPTTPRAYQILVATSEEKLKADSPDLWDSGRVISDTKTAQYEGKPLPSLQRCYWKVRVWNDYDTASLYTEPASWQMALSPF
jgi:alpha-L-rhamnosidase